jgi:hypothetical protein
VPCIAAALYAPYILTNKYYCCATRNITTLWGCTVVLKPPTNAPILAPWLLNFHMSRTIRVWFLLRAVPFAAVDPLDCPCATTGCVHSSASTHAMDIFLGFSSRLKKQTAMSPFHSSRTHTCSTIFSVRIAEAGEPCDKFAAKHIKHSSSNVVFTMTQINKCQSVVAQL